MNASLVGRVAQAILLPVAVLGGYLLTSAAGGFLEDAWEDFLGPFLITYWIGFGFTMAWDMVSEQVHAERLPPITIAITGVLGALILLSMLGGVDALLDDPWLFGVAIAPGLRLAGPWLAGNSGQGPRMQKKDRSPRNQESSDG